ncbi:pentatricopeptide repeat-containing protein At1g80880, mitochondrial [Beta vulgaris subsp. vulgaris]|uniref:pentatricopeptide repeat-containing protein At1g80880, mitochondrial n=1 Tax=Beta vulgaris subsp. vulgaris TaxID=3555 RepID=UPI002036A7BE|nr:pentatricopeptide repeat-containing protein At1g80880, mitochondrial [Beta vulgaris subsp. vulgaris]
MMAFPGLSIRRLILHQLQFRSSLSSFASRPEIFSSSNCYLECFFSQTFRRTLSTPFHCFLHDKPTLYFSTFQPSSVRCLYNPIDFNDVESKINQNDELGVFELVELVRRTKDYTSKKEAIDFIAGSGLNFDANQVYLAIWELRNDWKLALLAFELNEKGGCISEKILGLIVWVLGTHQKFDIAWSLIRDRYRSVGIRQAMLAVIERYAAANNYEKAIKTFHFMEKLTLSPDQNALYTVISALCRYGNIEEAEDFMQNNKKLYPLETEGFNIILHGWCDILVDIVEAKRVWREMASCCITPDAMSYAHMISCFSRVGNLFDSLRLYDEMKKRGWIPGLDVYNSMIYVMAHENCLSEALKILEKIKEGGLRPDSRSYNFLISPLCEAEKFKEARNLLSIMKQEGAQPTVETYQAFLKGASLEGTFEILSQMKKDQVGPDNCTFLLIFNRFFKLGEPVNVLKVWVEMGYFGVHPESEHYKSLISGLANCGCLMKAKELHTEMLSNGYVDDPKLKKLLQGPEQGSRHGRVESVNFKRLVNESKSSYASHIRPPRGWRKHGGKTIKKKQRFERS